MLIASDPTDVDIKTAIVRMVLKNCKSAAALEEIKKALSIDSHKVDETVKHYLSPLLNDRAELTDAVKQLIKNNPDISDFIDNPPKTAITLP